MEIEQIVKIEQIMKIEGIKVAPRARNDEQNMNNSCIVIYVARASYNLAIVQS